MTLSIFLSHSTVDNDWCDSFVEELRKYDVDIWYDRQSLYLGEDWVETIGKEITDRDIFLVIITPDAMDSKWVKRERNLAMAIDKPIVGILHKKTKIFGIIQTYQLMNAVEKDAIEVATLIARHLKLTLAEQPQRSEASSLTR